MMNVQWLYGSVTASLVVLLSITLLVLRKRLHPQTSGLSIDDILNTLNIDKPLPPNAAHGWKLCAVKYGQRVWIRHLPHLSHLSPPDTHPHHHHHKHKHTSPPHTNRLQQQPHFLIHGCCTKVAASAQTVYGYLKDSSKYVEWNHELTNVMVKRKSVPMTEVGSRPSKSLAELEMTHSDLLAADTSFVRNPWINFINYTTRLLFRRNIIEKVLYIERRWHSEDNGCMWLMERTGMEWTLYYIQPVADTLDGNECQLSIISSCHVTRGPALAPLYPALKLSALQQACSGLSTQYVPCVGISSSSAILNRQAADKLAAASKVTSSPVPNVKAESSTSKVEHWLLQRVRTLMADKTSDDGGKEKERAPTPASAPAPAPAPARVNKTSPSTFVARPQPRPSHPSDSDNESSSEATQRPRKSSAVAMATVNKQQRQVRMTPVNGDTDRFATVQQQDPAAVNSRLTGSSKSLSSEEKLNEMHKSTSTTLRDTVSSAAGTSGQQQQERGASGMTSSSSSPLLTDQFQQPLMQTPKTGSKEYLATKSSNGEASVLMTLSSEPSTSSTEKNSFVRFLQSRSLGSSSGEKDDTNKQQDAAPSSPAFKNKFMRSRLVLAAKKQQTVFQGIFKKLQTSFDVADGSDDSAKPAVNDQSDEISNIPEEESTGDNLAGDKNNKVTDGNGNVTRGDVLEQFEYVLSPGEVRQVEADLSENALVTLADDCYTHLVSEKSRTVNLNISLPYDLQSASAGGWIYCGLERDVVVLRKLCDNDVQVQSYMGKGLIPVAPKAVFEALRNPRTRFAYDESLKKLDILHTFVKTGIKIVHSQHEISQLFKKESRDFCVMCSEKAEGAKYLLAILSVPWSHCPPDTTDVPRGKFLSSGWIVEPCMRNNKLYSMVTYIVQLELRGTAGRDSGGGVGGGREAGGGYLLEELAAKQPLCIAALRDYLAPARRTKKSGQHQPSPDKPTLINQSHQPLSLRRLTQTGGDRRPTNLTLTDTLVTTSPVGTRSFDYSDLGVSAATAAKSQTNPADTHPDLIMLQPLMSTTTEQPILLPSYNQHNHNHLQQLSPKKTTPTQHPTTTVSGHQQHVTGLPPSPHSVEHPHHSLRHTRRLGSSSSGHRHSSSSSQASPSPQQLHADILLSLDPLRQATDDTGRYEVVDPLRPVLGTMLHTSSPSPFGLSTVTTGQNVGDHKHSPVLI